jgi:hypothetical protein
MVFPSDNATSVNSTTISNPRSANDLPVNCAATRLGVCLSLKVKGARGRIGSVNPVPGNGATANMGVAHTNAIATIKKRKILFILPIIYKNRAKVHNIYDLTKYTVLFFAKLKKKQYLCSIFIKNYGSF